MCHSHRAGPRCSSCHKPAPRHRCRCPEKYASNTTISPSQDGPPPYDAVNDQQPPTSIPFSSRQSRCGDRSYRRCDYKRRRHCHGPIYSLVSLIIRKVQEKRDKEREGYAANVREKMNDGAQERGVIEVVEEKKKKGMDTTEVEDEGKDKDVKIATKSMRSTSL